MANIYENMNVRQKLAKARLYFLNQKVQKSGKNMHLEFKYFELEDIVPPAIRIFARVGLTTNIEFTDDKAVMSVFNADNIDEAPLTFTVPYREVKPIISNQGKEVTNPMQALGSSITYLRRYTYNPDVAGSVTSGTLKKISSAADIVTLKLYYDLTVYNVTVENDGNGSASAAPASATMGGKITLTSTPNSGYRFKEWHIVSGDVTISGDVFTMPAGNVVVKAVFERKSSDGSGRDSSSDRDTSSSAIRKDPIRGWTSSDRGIIIGAANSIANDGYSHWMQDDHGWWLRFADNSYPKGQKRGTSGTAYVWELINGSWWAFDENGYAKIGWLRDDTFGGWFYIDPERGMQTGWVRLGGAWYYFHQVSDGRKGIMYAGRKTPDGYYVDENGAWMAKKNKSAGI